MVLLLPHWQKRSFVPASKAFRASLDSKIPFPKIYPSSMQRYEYKNIYDGSAYDGKQLESSLSIERGLVQ